MFRFAEPIYLWLLLLIPLLAIIRFYFRRKRKAALRRFGDIRLLMQLSPYFSRFRPLIKFWLLQGVLIMLIIMLARPQMGTKINKDKHEGIEAIIALDISNSMLAEDVMPSRLEKSKMMVQNLIDHFQKDKVGLVVFAGDAFVQLPITADYVSAKMFLDDISPALIEAQGTDIGQAIDLSIHSFTADEKTGKAIIVITDGEDHEGNAEAMAQAAEKKGIKVFMLGIGSPQGAPIPLEEGGYITDKEGNTVMTALNEAMCRKIAEAGKGTYIHVDNSSLAEERLDREISKIQKGEIENIVYSDFDEQYQAVGILAILLMIAEVIVMEAKNKVTQRWNLFGRKKMSRHIFIIIVMSLMSCVAMAQTDRQFIREGNKLYRNGEYVKAESAYRKAMARNNKNAIATYNLGCAQMRQNNDSSAIETFSNTTAMTNDKTIRSKAWHNTGTILQHKKQYKEAIEAYKEALRNNPKDNDTRYNLALCKHLLRQQQQQQKQQNKNQDKNDKDNNKDNNNNKDNKDQKNKDDKNEKDKDNDKDKNKQQENNNNENKSNRQMSRENAEQLLNAAMQQEKETQKKLKKAMQQPSRKQLDKNW